MVPGHGRLRLDSRSSFFLDVGKARSDRKQPRRVTSTSIRVMDSVAVGSRIPPFPFKVQGTRVPGRKLFFPVTVKIGGASGYRTLECFDYVLWRLVHVGETFNGFAGFGL